jgi:hypothetical protein
MRIIIGLTFLLGLISVFVPLKFLGITTRRRGVMLIVVSFGLAALYGLIFDPANTGSKPSNSTTSASAATPSAATSAALTSRSSTAKPSNWRYSEQQDKMRNQTTRYASLESNNQLSFDFPYNGGSTGTLTLRLSPKYGKDVILQIEKGQFLCSSFDGCAVHVKFDKRPIEVYSAGEATDGSSNVLFIHNYAGFLKQLRQAKSLTIEAHFYQEGWRQLEFSPAGLNW